MDWTNQTFKQLAERAEQRNADNPDFEKYAGRYGKSVKEWKADRKKAASHKPQAASATKKPQMIFKTILEFEKDK